MMTCYVPAPAPQEDVITVLQTCAESVPAPIPQPTGRGQFSYMRAHTSAPVWPRPPSPPGTRPHSRPSLQDEILLLRSQQKSEREDSHLALRQLEVRGAASRCPSVYPSVCPSGLSGL